MAQAAPGVQLQAGQDRPQAARPEAAAMTVPNAARLTHVQCACKFANGAVESSFLGGRRTALAAIFMPEFRACPAMAGRRVPAMPRGCPRQLSNAPATRAAVESLLRGDRNATLEASMVTSDRDEPCCAPAERRGQ